MTAQRFSRLGRYEIQEEIGKGAMGIVYLAKDPLIGRHVALKTFRILDSSDQELNESRERFIREAQSAGILSHPNIVTIHDVVEATDEGLTFIAMEYVRGTDLKELLRRDEPFDLPTIADIVWQVAEALEYAHSKGVVHRDIKPANIMMTADGRVKITDFGIARMNNSNLTVSGQLLGTPNYMAPEQIQGRDVDHRADIFSLGVVLYEMLTRQKPFRGDNLTMVTHRIVNEDFTPPEEHVGEVPPQLKAVLVKALAKQPTERYQRVGELARDLRNAVEAQKQDKLNDTQEVPLVRAGQPPPTAAAAPPAPPSPAAAPPPPPVAPPPVAAVPAPPPTLGPPAGLPPTVAIPLATVPPPVAARPPAAPRGAAPAVPSPPAPPAPAAAAPVNVLSALPAELSAPLPPVVAAPPGPAGKKAAKPAKAKPEAKGDQAPWLSRERPPLRRLLIAGAIALVAGLAGNLLALVLVQPADTSSAEASRDSEIRAYFRYLPFLWDGRDRLAQGDVEGAVTSYREAERLAPSVARIHHLREEAERRRGDQAELTQRASEADLLVSRGNEAFGRRRYDEAVSIARQALALLPGHPPAVELLGRAQTELDKRAAARTSAPVTPASAPEPAPPPVTIPTAPEPAPAPVETPAPTGDATLHVQFVSDQSAGVLTLYAGQQQLLRESFKFTQKTGFFRSKNISGSFERTLKIKPGQVTLRVYVALDKTRTEILDGNFLPGSTRTLEVKVGAEGELSVQLR